MRILQIEQFRKNDASFVEFYTFNSTAVGFFSQVMKGVVRNPKGDSKKKGGLKVHIMTDEHTETMIFVKISEVKIHIKKFYLRNNFLRKSLAFTRRNMFTE